MPKKTVTALSIITLSLGLWLQQAQACSRILWNDNQLGVFTARTMDWPESTQPLLTVFPRGPPRHGGRIGAEKTKDLYAKTNLQNLTYTTFVSYDHMGLGR
jgi:penicillin V acylase-like amidase (Ntn superfamily)